MKILHICLANFYIDDYSYQENILPKFHKNQGHEVQILASTETYNSNVELHYVDPSSYFTSNSIPIKRIAYVSWMPKALVKKLRIYRGIKAYLNEFKPEIIFMHDCQFLSILSFSKYAKKNPVKIYIDSHTDFVNSGKNWISKNILHKVIYKFCAKNIEKYTSKFYGTLPLRNEFLKDVYNINSKKIELLPFGADDSLFNWEDQEEIRIKTRLKLKIADDEFIFITGGKIDRRKNIHLLLEAWQNLIQEKKIRKARLIIFGKPNEEMRNTFLNSINNKSITYIDWLPSADIHKYFFAADIAIFPGTHSVLWEEAVGLGLPCIFKKWNGIQHIDLGGNCVFIENVEVKVLEDIIMKIANEKGYFDKLRNNAKLLGPKKLIYSQISKRAIEL